MSTAGTSGGAGGPHFVHAFPRLARACVGLAVLVTSCGGGATDRGASVAAGGPASSAAAPRPSASGRSEAAIAATPKPSASPAAPASAPACLDPRVRAAVEGELRDRYKVSSSDHELAVDFACDPAPAPAHEILLESGSGHGGSLVLTKLVRDGDAYAVRRLRWSEYHQRGLVIERARIPAATLDARLPRIRAALLATLREVEIPRPPGSGLGLSGTASSSDYHRRLTLSGPGAKTLDRQFSGYAAGGPDEVPLALATEGLLAALPSSAFTTDAQVDADRAFFADPFVRMASEPKPFWWVEERFVSMAAVLGSRPIVPSLVALAKKPFAPGSPEARRHRGAVAAIGAVLGFNAKGMSSAAVLRRATAKP